MPELNDVKELLRKKSLPKQQETFNEKFLSDQESENFCKNIRSLTSHEEVLDFSLEDFQKLLIIQAEFSKNFTDTLNGKSIQDSQDFFDIMINLSEVIKATASQLNQKKELTVSVASYLFQQQAMRNYFNVRFLYRLHSDLIKSNPSSEFATACRAFQTEVKVFISDCSSVINGNQSLNANALESKKTVYEAKLSRMFQEFKREISKKVEKDTLEMKKKIHTFESKKENEIFKIGHVFFEKCNTFLNKHATNKVKQRKFYIHPEFAKKLEELEDSNTLWGFDEIQSVVINIEKAKIVTSDSTSRQEKINLLKLAIEGKLRSLLNAKDELIKKIKEDKLHAVARNADPILCSENFFKAVITALDNSYQNCEKAHLEFANALATNERNTHKQLRKNLFKSFDAFNDAFVAAERKLTTELQTEVKNNTKNYLNKIDAQREEMDKIAKHFYIKLNVVQSIKQYNKEDFPTAISNLENARQASNTQYEALKECHKELKKENNLIDETVNKFIENRDNAEKANEETIKAYEGAQKKLEFNKELNKKNLEEILQLIKKEQKKRTNFLYKLFFKDKQAKIDALEELKNGLQNLYNKTYENIQNAVYGNEYEYDNFSDYIVGWKLTNNLVLKEKRNKFDFFKSKTETMKSIDKLINRDESKIALKL